MLACHSVSMLFSMQQGMLAAPKLIQNGVLKPSPDTDLVPFMGSAEVARAANTTFFELLRNIAAPNVQQPTREAVSSVHGFFFAVGQFAIRKNVRLS